MLGNGFGADSVAVGVVFHVGVIGLVALGNLVVARRGANAIGWLLVGGGFVFVVDDVLRMYGTIAQTAHLSGRDIALALEDFMFVPAVGLMLIFVGLLFPTGRLLSRRWRWVAWGSAAAIVLAYVSNSLAVSPTDYGVAGATNPLRPSGLVVRVLTGFASASWLLLPIVTLSAVVAMVLRYRQGDNEVRHQIRIVMCATVLFAASFAVYATTASSSGYHASAQRIAADTWQAAITILVAAGRANSSLHRSVPAKWQATGCP